jgi:hypothetical protein
MPKVELKAEMKISAPELQWCERSVIGTIAHELSASLDFFSHLASRISLLPFMFGNAMESGRTSFRVMRASSSPVPAAQSSVHEFCSSVDIMYAGA